MIKPNIFISFFIGITLMILSWCYYSYIYNQDRSILRGYDIEKADFFGINSQGKLYNLKAHSITKLDKDLYKLNTLYTKYYMDQDNEQYTESFSKTGIFNKPKNLLVLNGDVEFILSEGYRMITDNFSINMNKNIAVTNDEVLLSGVQGKLLSKKGMTIYMKQKKIIFHGPIQSMFIEDKVTK